MQAVTDTATLRDAKQIEHKAHDLLRLRSLPSTEDIPVWLAHTFAKAPFAVVRRAEARSGFIAVGFRGPSRSDRYGTFAAIDSVLSAWSPEDLLHRRIHSARERLGAFAALRELVDARGFDALAWGPTGSVGFELATGQPAVTNASDLDLLVRTPSPLARAHARSIRARLDTMERERGLRIDVQLDTPAGGVALSEWAQDKPRVMARSACGPRLVDDPWAPSTVPSEAQG
jgi:phosphoribosyl-dephospho-CoA transferase